MFFTAVEHGWWGSWVKPPGCLALGLMSGRSTGLSGEGVGAAGWEVGGGQWGESWGSLNWAQR